MWAPYFATEHSGDARAWRMGLRFTSGANAELGLEFGRCQSVRADPEAAIRRQGAFAGNGCAMPARSAERAGPRRAAVTPQHGAQCYERT